MNTQAEKNTQQETNQEQVKPVKRVLRATVLRHMIGISTQTNLRAGAGVFCNRGHCMSIK
jgi:hypothetical protein